MPDINRFFVVTLFECRPAFESLPTSEEKLNSQKAAVDEGGGIKTIETENEYDRELAKADRARSQSVGGGGRVWGRVTPGCADKTECEAVSNGGRNGSSAQERAEERIPLAGRRSISYSVAQDLEGDDLHDSVYGGDSGSSRSAGVGMRQGGGFEASGGGKWDWGKMKKNAYVRECLLPFALLKEKRVRTMLSVLVVFSVRNVFSVRCTYKVGALHI